MTDLVNKDETASGLCVDEDGEHDGWDYLLLFIGLFIGFFKGVPFILQLLISGLDVLANLLFDPIDFGELMLY